MSRIGIKPITIDKNVKITPDGKKVVIEGPKGVISLTLADSIDITLNGNIMRVTCQDQETNKNMYGLFRTLLQNAIIGVTQNWTKTLELIGVGYRAQVNGNELVLHVGFSHPVKIPAPIGITFQVQENKIVVSGVDKYLVGEMAAVIKRVKKPEPYKGKGIRYENEYIRKKLGKAAKTVGATGAK